MFNNTKKLYVPYIAHQGAEMLKKIKIKKI